MVIFKTLLLIQLSVSIGILLQKNHLSYKLNIGINKKAFVNAGAKCTGGSDPICSDGFCYRADGGRLCPTNFPIFREKNCDSNNLGTCTGNLCTSAFEVNSLNKYLK
jgi:hypothetical protein